ncbi:MAG: hypothetical protein D6737_19990 [Chloroflexi bacterium]|nr:MAG: hypothetical protein D6737_19990 [Chloroflexota bacterium]
MAESSASSPPSRITRLRASLNIKRIRVALNLLGWVIAVGFFVLAWRRLIEREDWEQTLTDLNVGYVVLALVLLLGGLIIRSQLAYASHRGLSYDMPHTRAFRFWFLAQMGKYIPGGVWLFAARVVFYRNNGMPMMLASAATVWEITSILSMGLLLSIASFGLFENALWGYAIGIIAALMFIAMMLSATSLPWRILSRLRHKTFEKMLATQRELGNGRYKLLAQLSTMALVSWVVVGTGFYFLVLAVDGDSNISWWTATISYTVAWTIGFLTIFAPAGLGVREGIITLLLTPIVGETTALTVALLARLWATTAEGILIGTALVWHFSLKGFNMPGTQPTPDVSPEQTISG